MAEKDATARLRRAVKENNLFLVKRLVQKTDQRNTDFAPRRYTSLAWAAVLGHEETFEFLLTNEHDDEELSRDSESNTILMLLAEHTAVTSSYVSNPEDISDTTGATLRMARLYFDRYSEILDWSNIHGKTALHIAALKGNEELARMLCDLGADFDLSDNKGNTPLHYASSWGRIPVVQLLIERGCVFAARNNQGFTASDYAYSFGTLTTIQESVWAQVENKKKSRRGVINQAAARGSEWGSSAPVKIPPPREVRPQQPPSARMRSGSGTSRTTATSDSGESAGPGAGQYSQSSLSASSSNSIFHPQQGSHPAAQPHGLNVPKNDGQSSKLSPVANRMRERDADAMSKYMRRNRSDTSSDGQAQNGASFTSGPSADGDDIGSLNYSAGTSTPTRRLRPSLSAAQLRTDGPISPLKIEQPHAEVRTRSGTNPTTTPSATHLGRSASSSKSPVAANFEQADPTFMGPSSQFAHFPEPEEVGRTSSEKNTANPPATTTSNRRLAFHIMSRPSLDALSGSNQQHKRGISASSQTRGPGG